MWWQGSGGSGLVARWAIYMSRCGLWRAPKCLVILGSCAALLVACNHPSAATTTEAVGSICPEGCASWQRCEGGKCECVPRCSDDNACLSDECGGFCPCPPGLAQSATGAFVPEAECHDTCASAGWACGNLCGSDCGSCAAGTACNLGRCACEPTCDGTRCDDGCGGYCPCAQGTVCNAATECVSPGHCKDTCSSQKLSCGEICGTTCGTCAAAESCVQGSCIPAVSCADCPLSLRLVGKKLVQGKLSEVTLAVEFSPAETEARPRMADFRIRSSRPAVVRAARGGPALANARKDLVLFEPWAEPWRRRADGAYQFLAYEATNTELVADGRVVELTLSLDEWGPVKFSLQRREQTFAPSEADLALQSSPYDSEVIVTR